MPNKTNNTKESYPTSLEWKIQFYRDLAINAKLSESERALYVSVLNDLVDVYYSK